MDWHIYATNHRFISKSILGYLGSLGFSIILGLTANSQLMSLKPTYPFTSEEADVLLPIVVGLLKLGCVGTIQIFSVSSNRLVDQGLQLTARSQACRLILTDLHCCRIPLYLGVRMVRVT